MCVREEISSSCSDDSDKLFHIYLPNFISYSSRSALLAYFLLPFAINNPISQDKSTQ